VDTNGAKAVKLTPHVQVQLGKQQQHMPVVINQRRRNNMATTSAGVRALYTAQMAKRSNAMAYGKKKKKKTMKPRPKKY
jgi:maltoporin